MSSRYSGRHTRPRGRSSVLTAAVLAAVLILAAAAAVFALRSRPQQPQTDPPGSASHQPGGSASGSTGGSSSSQDTGSSVRPLQTPDGSDVPPETPPPQAASYDFSQPAPERKAVDNSYFKDAAFVGDSRTDGFLLYSGINGGKNLTSNGLSIFSLPTKKALTIDGEQYTLLEALALEEYGKVYLSLGVNELGYGNDTRYYEKYGEAIDEIRRLQPNAVIYIQGLIPLNEGQIVAANGNKYNLTNEHLRVYNGLMRQIAEEKQVVFLDLYSEFVDENGELPEEASRDGVHLLKEPCQQWLAYLQTHTVEFDTLYPDGISAPAAQAPEETTENGSDQG